MTVAGSNPGSGSPQQPNVGGGDNSPTPQPAPPAGPLARIPDSAPAYVPIGSSFQAFATNFIGTAGSGQDGWDALYAIPAGAIDGDQASLSDLDAALEALAFVPGAFAAATFAPVDTELDNLETLVGAYFSS